MVAAFDDRPESEVPMWADDEAPEPEEDELQEELLEVADLASNEARSVAPSPAPPVARRDIAFEAKTFIADMNRAWETTPHRCTCGEKVLAAGQTCQQCLLQETERRDRARHEHRIACELPKRYRWASFDAPELAQRVLDGEAIARARAAATDRSIDRIVLWGPAGAGKTSLAVAALRLRSVERMCEAHYADARALSVARSMSSLGSEPVDVTNAMHTGCLLLDDLGIDNPQQHGSAVLDVIFARHRDGAPLIVTLAVAPEDLAGRYGDGFARRLLEDDGACSLIQVRR